jgi:hypothetical protein
MYPKMDQKRGYIRQKMSGISINEHLHWYMLVVYNPGALLLSENTEPLFERKMNLWLVQFGR